MSTITDRGEDVLKDKIAKANVLLESLPYIRKFAGKIVVIKYGGSLMVHDDLKQKFAEDIVLLKYVGINPVIVHGGGKEISKWMKKVGKESVFIDGLRVTDLETMEITEMVLTGKINSEVVSLINSHGGKAVGLSGKDANLFTAERVRTKENVDLGFVGDITDVDTTLLNTLNSTGYICENTPEQTESTQKALEEINKKANAKAFMFAISTIALLGAIILAILSKIFNWGI